jgi:GR25 family glycosyltransferase involved in LPS biosynthesis
MKHHIEYERVRAVEPPEIGFNPFVSGNVAACWLSHQKAAQSLLNSIHSHAVILEDDAVLTKSFVKVLKHLESNKIPEIDLIQLGYLTHRGKLDFPEFDPIFRRLTDLRAYLGSTLVRYDFLFRNWIVISRFILKKMTSGLLAKLLPLNVNKKVQIYNVQAFIQNERRLRKSLGIKKSLIYHSFEPGTHCYVINRDFARVMLQINNPVYLAADLLLMSIAKSHNFKVIRVCRSLVSQSKSPSSISRKS